MAMRFVCGPAAGARGVVRRLAVVVAVVMASLATGVSGAGATPPPDAFNATAGVTFSGAVGGFFTSNCGNFGCGTLNPFVTIDWGDGATSRVQAVPTCPAMLQFLGLGHLGDAHLSAPRHVRGVVHVRSRW